MIRPRENLRSPHFLPARNQKQRSARAMVVPSALSMPGPLSFGREETLHEPIGDNQSRNGTSPRRERERVCVCMCVCERGCARVGSARDRARGLTGVCLGTRANLL